MRTGRWFFLASFFLILGIAVPLSFRFLPQFVPLEIKPLLQQVFSSSAPDVAANTFKNLAQVGILILVLISAGSVAHEVSHRQLELVFAKPVGRTALLWAKWSTLSVAFLTSLAIGLLANYFYTAALFPPPLPAIEYWLGGALFFLYGLFALSLVFLASTLFPSIWAAIFSLSLLLLLSFIPVILPTSSGFLPSALLECSSLVARGELPVAEASTEVLLTLSATLFLLLLASFAIRRKEL